MISKKSCLPTLPGTPVFKPGMRRLVLGGKYQRYIKGGAGLGCGQDLLATEILNADNPHGPGNITQIGMG